MTAPGGGRAVDESRGEPAFVFEAGGQTLAFVVEGLGTKSMIARACEDQLGAHGFHAVAYDTVAAIVNDLCCVGAVPLVVNAYFATGASDWYSHADRQAGLLAGWRRGCEDAGATWGGGESPALSGLVSADEIELAGSAVGLVPSGSPILGADLADGDEIVLVDSSGLHANGASLARRIAAQLPGGYGFELPGGATFGRALLEPSVIYVPLVRALLDSDVDVHYLSHITGHGFLKLMRPRAAFTYVIDVLPEVPEVLSFLVAARGDVARRGLPDVQHGRRLRGLLRGRRRRPRRLAGGRLRHARPRRRRRRRGPAARGPAGARRHVRVRRARPDPARLSPTALTRAAGKVWRR